MFKTVLVSLTGYPSDLTVLETAAEVAERFSAHLDCLHVSLDAADAEAAVPFLAGHAQTLEQMRGLGHRVAERSSKAREAFNEICARRSLAIVEEAKSGNAAASVAFREVIGADLDETINAARLRDLAVIARDSRNVTFEPDPAGTIMLSSGRPVLVPPRKAAKAIGSRVAIAWKNTAEAARAVASAMPFIANARLVTVLAANEDDDAERFAGPARSLVSELTWHGVNAQLKLLPYSLKPTGETILDEAYHLDADLLVLGGYGHSRLREIVFGGVTREILAESEVSVLMCH
jgi:nucleotide-binding universal stress UspA family protein